MNLVEEDGVLYWCSGECILGRVFVWTGYFVSVTRGMTERSDKKNDRKLQSYYLQDEQVKFLFFSKINLFFELCEKSSKTCEWGCGII